MQGLVIDDYFALSKVPKGVLVQSPSEQCLSVSKALYSSFGIKGSDDKDVVGERKAKIIGACVNASEQCQSRGHVLISAPAEKRYALSWVSLQVAQLTHTSDSLHLCLIGGWMSLLMFRRPMMSILQKAFHLLLQLKRKLCTVVLNTKIWYLLTNNNVFVQSTKFIDNNKRSIIVQKGLSLCLLPWRSSKGSNSFV